MKLPTAASCGVSCLKFVLVQIINQHAYIVSRYGPIKTYLKIDERESG